MLKTKTLIVVGAGASKEFGLPIGVELPKSIAQVLSFDIDAFGEVEGGDADIRNIARRQLGYTAREVYAASKLIRDGLPLSFSIDNFLDKHHANPPVQALGRLALVHCLLKAESRSALFVGRTQPLINFAGLQDNWLNRLFTALQDRVRLEHIDRIFDELTIITFNYDRCIEHYLHHALQANYGVGEAEAAEVVKRLRLVHVYGALAPLPWQGGRRAISFGQEHVPLVDLWQNIRTYADEIEDTTTVQSMREWATEVETVFYLGFSYLPQNMTFVTPYIRDGIHHAYGSAFGMSSFDTSEISKALQKTVVSSMTQDVNLVGVTAAELLKSYSRALF